MDSHQHCLGRTPLCLLMQETVLKIAQEISPPVPQPTFHLHGGPTDVAGHWLPSPPLAMGPTRPAPPSLHPAPPRRSYISCHTNRRQMNYTSYRNIFAPPKALLLRADAGTLPCGPDLEV